jgi:hypothetical protein
MNGRGNAYSLSVRKPEGKRPLGIPVHRWADNTKIDLGEIGLGNMEWIDLAQDIDQLRAVVNPAMIFSGSNKCWEYLYCRSDHYLLKEN